MIGDKLTYNHLPRTSAQPPRSKRDVPCAQEALYNFLLEIVKSWSPEDVLTEFKHLFIHHANAVSSATLPYLYEIVFSNQEQEFRNTLKRSCYILINNWEITRHYEAIQKLLQLFSDPILSRHTISPTLKRLREWVRNFVESEDFQELKLFIARYEDSSFTHWSQRYTSYLLVPQYINLQNPLEQRQAARNLSRQLKENYKFELAMYTARSQGTLPGEKPLKNPTGLGDEVLRLIKRIIAKRGFFNYPSLAQIFLTQTQTLSYRDFKRSLRRYLMFSIEHHKCADIFKQKLIQKLDALYVDHHDEPINSSLILRTANRVIEYLTTEDHQEPAPLFVLFLSQGSPLTLVILLLKLVLICEYVRTHLEARIADLIQYYEIYSDEECRWVINFFEIFRVTMAIYAENVEYNLVNMGPQNREADGSEGAAYRIFSQMKQRGMFGQRDALGEASREELFGKSILESEILEREMSLLEEEKPENEESW